MVVVDAGSLVLVLATVWLLILVLVHSFDIVVKAKVGQGPNSAPVVGQRCLVLL
jgi:hypothetical protein